MREAIKKYFYSQIIDESVDKQECIKNNLPYYEDGKLYNTHHFNIVGTNFLKTGHYTNAPFKSEAWVNFWLREHKKSLRGVKIGQVRITGYNYFFLNFYPMKVAKEGRSTAGLPSFWLHLFYLFHLIEYCEVNKKDLAGIKVRGCGFSEVFASVGVRDFFLFERDENGRPRFDSLMYLGYHKNHIGGGDGIFTKVTAAIDQINTNCEMGIYQPTTHTKRMGEDMLWIAGYEEVTNRKKVQTGGQVEAILCSKPDNVRGGRRQKLFFEEAGVNPELGKVLSVADPLLVQGGERTGCKFIWGTSNEDPRGIEAFKEILTVPDAYNCLCFENPYKGVSERPELALDITYNPFDLLIPEEEVEHVASYSGLFIPAYDLGDRNKGERDEHGNPVRKLILNRWLHERKILLKGDYEAYLVKIADHPFTIEEALMKRGTNFFDKDLLAKQHYDLTIAKSYDLPKKGKVVKTTSGFDFIPVADGVLSLIEGPLSNGTDLKYKNLYVIGYDGIDTGNLGSQSGKGSSICAIVYKRKLGIDKGDYPVAIYFTRPDDERDAFDDIANLALWYNAQVCIEDSKNSIKAYFRAKNLTHLLYKRPNIASQNILVNNSLAFGVPANEKYIKFGLDLINKYIKDYYYKLQFPELIDQLLNYSYEDKGMFDQVAAFQMVLIADDDMYFLKPKESKPLQYKGRIGWYKDPYNPSRKRYGIIYENEHELKFGTLHRPPSLDLVNNKLIDNNIDIELT